LDFVQYVSKKQNENLILSQVSDSTIRINELENINLGLKNKISTLEKKNSELINELNDLKTKLLDKMDEMNNLNNQMKDLKINNNINDNFVNKNEMIAILIKSVDGKVEMPCLCHISDTFATLEELLYKAYPDYRNCDTSFKVNGKKILRFKTIQENDIKNQDKIILNVIE
jgi:predicted RNase H-like nuclease (RuvC/YqgF family)